jgi:hypothetical protein
MINQKHRANALCNSCIGLTTYAEDISPLWGSKYEDFRAPKWAGYIRAMGETRCDVWKQ